MAASSREDQIDSLSTTAFNFRHIHLFIELFLTFLQRKSSSVEGDGPEKKITRLAIGTEGGFDPNGGKEYDITHEYSIVILPEFTVIPYPCDKLPDVVSVFSCTSDLFL